MTGNKVIEIDLTDNMASDLRHGADIGRWAAFIDTAKAQGFISISLDYENGYYDSVDIRIKGMRRETNDELSERRKRERNRAKEIAERERQQYESLKAKFENKNQ